MGWTWAATAAARATTETAKRMLAVGVIGGWSECDRDDTGRLERE